MPIPVACRCGKSLRLKDELAGRRVKCPACGGVLTVPSAEPEFEVVDDEPAPPPKPKKADAPAKAGKKPVRAAAADDDEDDPPPKKSGRRLLDEDEDEEDERPRKRAGKKSRKGKKTSEKPFWKTPLGLILNGIGLILLGAGAIALYFFDEKRRFGIVIAGGICVLGGFGSIITGLTGGSDDDEDEE